MPRLFGDAVLRAFDANGEPVSGARCYVYTAGTTTPVTTYSDAALTTPQAHPVVADSSGVFAPIFVTAGSYKANLTTSADAALPGYPVDNFVPPESDGNVIVTPTGGATARALADHLEVTIPNDPSDSAANRQAIQAEIDNLAANGGGRVILQADVYKIDSTITLKQGVRLVGRGYGFKNEYNTGGPILWGTWLQLDEGANCDVIRTLADVSDLNPGQFPRQHSGIYSMGIYGRCSTSSVVSNTALNQTGWGVSVEGTSYFTMKEVAVYRCAQGGVRVISYDYGNGEGPRSNNNLRFDDVLCLMNAGVGFSGVGGDSEHGRMVAGYNGSHGFTSVTGTIVNATSWNNRGRGFSITTDASLVGCSAYSNYEPGIFLSNAEQVNISGCLLFQNGRALDILGTDQAGGPSAGITKTKAQLDAERSSVFIGAGCESISIVGTWMGDKTSTGWIPRTRWGIYSESTGFNLRLEANSYDGLINEPLNLADYSVLHGGVFDGERHKQHVSGISFNAWDQITTVSGTTLACGDRQMIQCNIPGGAAITDITSTSRNLPLLVIRNTSADNLSFIYDNLKLRLFNDKNQILRQNQAITFIKASGDIWQQISGPPAEIRTIFSIDDGTTEGSKVILDAGQEDSMWHIYATHTAGSGATNAIEAVVVADTTTPVILRKSSTGTAGFDLTVSGTDIVLSSTSSTTRAVRVVLHRTL